jgi:hypothetical protein
MGFTAKYFVLFLNIQIYRKYCGKTYRIQIIIVAKLIFAPQGPLLSTIVASTRETLSLVKESLTTHHFSFNQIELPLQTVSDILKFPSFKIILIASTLFFLTEFSNTILLNILISSCFPHFFSFLVFFRIRR